MKKKKPESSDTRKQFQVYLTPEERLLLERAAEYSGLPMATWIRQKAVEAARALDTQSEPGSR